MVEHNPLLDTDFLKMLYSYRQREIFARVISLTFDERPVEQIEGRVTGGSVNVDGTSSMRRSCSLTMVAQDVNINDYYWGLNNKFKLEIGLTNPKPIKEYHYWDAVNKKDVYPYKDYPDIIWFPMGLYLFTNFSVSYTTNNYTISVQGKDKMCLLNGQVNGSFFASITFDNEEYYDMKTGITTITKLPVKYIIAEAVHEYAGEPFSNIMVNDLDDLGIELLQYRGTAPMYLIIGNDNDNIGEVINITMNGNMPVYVGTEDSHTTGIYLNDMTEDADGQYRLDTRTQREGYNGEVYNPTKVWGGPEVGAAGPWTVAKITYGQTCGYRTTDIIYAGDLVGAIGESLTSVLDKIVTMLGEFEYFYDLEGHFVFQKKMNFIDHKFNPITSSEQYSDDLYADSYVENMAYTSAHTWTFDNNELVTAFNNTPDILNIKNDFSIWGERKSVSGAALPVHMRYALGKKPSYYKTYEGITYLTQDEYDILAETLGGIIFTKTCPVEGLDPNDWWDISEWAKYYAYCSALKNGKNPLMLSKEELANYYPQDRIYTYGSIEIDYLTLETIVENLGEGFYWNSNPNWNYPAQIVLLKRANDNTTLVDTHYLPAYGYGCSHRYEDFLPGNRYGVGGSDGYYAAYIYKPEIPEVEGITTDITDNVIISNDRVIICDWREIIYQMAKDYRKHNHEDDFYIQIRENNGKDTNGNWRYPDGMTSYEPFYIDLEGFWRQLYCPSYNEDGGFIDVIIEDDKLYTAKLENGEYSKLAELTLDMAPRTMIVHAVAQSVFNENNSVYEISPINKYLIINNKYNKDENQGLKLVLTFSEIVISGDYSESGWNQSVFSSPETLNFWFDMMDNGSEIANRYGIQSIGDRAKSVNDNTVKAIYFREVPTLIFTEDIETQVRKSGYVYMQIPEEVMDSFVISTQGKCAQDVLDEYLFRHTFCTESVSITAVPIYHLEPNTRIYVSDKNSKVDGEYIVSRISLPLTYNGTMNITATKAVERIY